MTKTMLDQINTWDRQKAKLRHQGVFFPGEVVAPKRPADEIVKWGRLLWAESDWVRHMADALGCSARTVQRWATGDTQPDASVWPKLHAIASRRINEITKLTKGR